MHNVFHLSQLCLLLGNMPPNSVECHVILNQNLYLYEIFVCMYVYTHLVSTIGNDIMYGVTTALLSPTWT